MNIKCANSSTLELKPTGISIWLPMQVFGALWSILTAQLSNKISDSIIVPATSRKMTARDNGDDAPRWKQNIIDVLSWFIRLRWTSVFLLKVPYNHELVRLWKVIDWQEINRLAAPYYKNAHGGRPAWAPAQLIAILILMFLYAVPYETRIIRLIQENIVWSWFCGFGLFGPFPTHDALYEFRKRVGPECFQKILTQVVLACMEAGLVDNELVHFDLTPQEANGHRWSPYERAVIVTNALIRYLELVWAGERPCESLPQSLKILAAKVALETLPHKSLKKAKAERVVESVSHWQQKAENGNPTWQEATEQLVGELFKQAGELNLPDKKEVTDETAGQKKEAVDVPAEQKKEADDQIAEQKKEVVDVPAEQKKEAVDVPAEQKKEALDAPVEQKKELTQNETTEEVVDMPPSTVDSIEAPALRQPKVLQNESEIPDEHEIVIDEITKVLIRTKLVDLAKDIIKDLPHTRGDLSARVGRTTNYTWFCGYLVGFVVDDAHQIITAVVLGAGNTKQANLFEPAIKDHIARVGKPAGVAADSAFDDYQIHLFLDGKEIEGHVTSREHSKPKDGGYGTDQVIWIDHVPFCPNNSPLESIGKPKKNGSQRFQGTKCGSCDSYERCYPSGEGKPKQFNLNPKEHRRWQENRQHNRTEEYKKAQNARFVSEGRFGLAKNNHKGNRAPYRSDVFNMIAALMMAIVMNLRILAKNK